ncbi:hypothetical protein [Carboxylicivirga caseinilyticus]|uniref:hypothetical protein n=1 Tax=Carboxylicivirga caseinilyticus TaxID=3417572 RepID=UPI003D33B957|nr:hypothetical protein [Marinilabiliaceae bacterium A049]
MKNYKLLFVLPLLLVGISINAQCYYYIEQTCIGQNSSGTEFNVIISQVYKAECNLGEIAFYKQWKEAIALSKYSKYKNHAGEIKYRMYKTKDDALKKRRETMVYHKKNGYTIRELNFAYYP